MACPKCENEEFEEASGLGIQIWLPGPGGRKLKRSICDRCGQPMAEREISSRTAELPSFKEMFPTVLFDEQERDLNTALTRLDLWKKLSGHPNPRARQRVEDFVAQVHQIARRLFYQLRDHAVEEGLNQGDIFLNNAGVVSVKNPKHQKDLDGLRKSAEEAAKMARADLEKAQDRQTPFKHKLNLYKRALANARAYLVMARSYKDKQTKVDAKRLREELEQKLVEAFEAGVDDVDDVQTTDSSTTTAEAPSEVESTQVAEKIEETLSEEETRSDDAAELAIVWINSLPKKDRQIKRYLRDTDQRKITEAEKATNLFLAYLDKGGELFSVNIERMLEKAAKNGGSIGQVKVSKRGKNGEKKKRTKKATKTK